MENQKCNYRGAPPMSTQCGLTQSARRDVEQGRQGKTGRGALRESYVIGLYCQDPCLELQLPRVGTQVHL